MKNGLREDQYSFDAKETRLEIQSSLGPLTQEDCVSQLDEEHTMEHQQPHPEISTAAAYEQTSTETTTQVQPETQNLDATPFDRRSGSVQHYKVYADNVDQLMYLSQWVELPGFVRIFSGTSFWEKTPAFNIGGFSGHWNFATLRVSFEF